MSKIPKIPKMGKPYPYPLIPFILGIPSMVLVLLTIYAGHAPGYLEDYHIVYFNTSTLGENLLSDASLKVRSAPAMPEITAPPTLLGRYHGASDQRRDLIGDALGGATSVLGDATSVAGQATSVAAGIASTVESEASKVTSLVANAISSVLAEVKDEMEKIEDELADELASLLGIHEWYSIHLIDLCYGNFTPKTTSPNATMAVMNCTVPFDFTVINITQMLDHDLTVGPFTLNLADLGIVQDMQSGINTMSKFLEIPVIIYYFGAVFIGLSILGSLAAVFLIDVEGQDTTKPVNPTVTRAVIVGNLGLATSAILFLFTGNTLITYAGKKVVQEVTEHGNKFGLYAYRGTKFLAISWATFALMALATLWWMLESFALLATYRWEKKGEKSRVVRLANWFGIIRVPAFATSRSGAPSESDASSYNKEWR